MWTDLDMNQKWYFPNGDDPNMDSDWSLMFSNIMLSLIVSIQILMEDGSSKIGKIQEI